MSLLATAFYVLSALSIIAALGVVIARNPVHSVLFLILTFFSAAGLFVLLGAEFLAMLLVVVYVGAVAVLFLFVVMMLDVDFAALKAGFSNYLPIGVAVAAILAGEFFFVGAAWKSVPRPPEDPSLAEPVTSNAAAIGAVMYDEQVLNFQLAGLVLLVAMVSAILLTLRHRVGVRRQNIADQVGRRRKDAVDMINVKPGEGLGG